jgi:hypothetical protein
MKWCVGILLMFWSASAPAQHLALGYGHVDWHVRSVNDTSVDSLALKLTAPFPTPLEKARAIYSWICSNIRYNVDIYRPVALRARFVPEPVDTTSEWKSADEMVAQKVLRRRLAVCEGYARLFKVLCQYAGLEAVVLNGYVRTNVDRSAQRFKTNHTWNAVRIDSAWHLVDATWGAGFVNYADEFVQEQNDFYFLTPPAQMIRDHYPEDLRWTLMAEPPTLSEFRKMPFRSKSFIKYGIEDYSPAAGIVEADIGDTLSFSISLKDVKRARHTIPDPFFDSAVYVLSPSSVFVKPTTETGSKVHYRHVVDGSAQWLHLVFNDDIILRYHLRRRERLASN